MAFLELKKKEEMLHARNVHLYIEHTCVRALQFICTVRCTHNVHVHVADLFFFTVNTCIVFDCRNAKFK